MSRIRKDRKERRLSPGKDLIFWRSLIPGADKSFKYFSKTKKRFSIFKSSSARRRNRNLHHASHNYFVKHGTTPTPC